MGAARETGVEVPIEAAVAALTSERLLAFLARQRWFGAKGETPTTAHVADWVPLPSADASLAMARIHVDLRHPEPFGRSRSLEGRLREGSAVTATYQLPIAVRQTFEGPAHAIIATIGRARVVDALYDDEFLAVLARGIVRGLDAGDPSGPHWLIDRARDIHGDASDLPPRIRIGSAEQSNSSIVIGEEVIIKLFRRLVPGVHPEVEVSRLLTGSGYTATPAFLGELRFQDEHGTTVAGLTQQFVPGAVDLWSHALERGHTYFVAPVDRDVANEFVEEAKRLGQTTRAMHAALARPTSDESFAPEPVTREDVERWAQRVQHSVRESLALLERQLESPRFPRERAAEARVLATRREHYVGLINEIADTLGDELGKRTRIHGDFHLGQVLRAPSGELLIIDFEGEPAKPLDERREKTSPLRDVAGMLRSFAYAAATLAMQDGARVQPHVRELRSARWERDVRAAFLDGYLAPADDDGSLPRNAEDTRRLIALFEADKVFYELSYELNNRPSWTWIPMRGISKLLVERSA